MLLKFKWNKRWRTELEIRSVFHGHVECNLHAEYQIKGPRSGALLVVQNRKQDWIYKLGRYLNRSDCLCYGKKDFKGKVDGEKNEAGYKKHLEK